jgi:PAS domain S-box-containing protein
MKYLPGNGGGTHTLPRVTPSIGADEPGLRLRQFGIEQALYAYFERTPEAMILIDEERRILAMNQAAEKLTGWESDQVAGKRHCYGLLKCRTVEDLPLNGNCPGTRAFTGNEAERVSTYWIRRKDGSFVRVQSEYTVVPDKREGRRVGVIRMEPTAKPEPKVKETQPGMPLWQVLAGALGLMIGFVLLIMVLEQTAHQWITLGSIQQIAPNQPTAMTFVHPGTTGADVKPGLVFVKAERGLPVTALYGHCPYDGDMVVWDQEKRTYVCPTDGSVFQEDGTFAGIGGKAWRKLPALQARRVGERIEVRVPKTPPTPTRDQPKIDYPGYM